MIETRPLVWFVITKLLLTEIEANVFRFEYDVLLGTVTICTEFPLIGIIVFVFETGKLKIVVTASTLPDP